MISLHWPFIIVTTGVLYLLLILTLPFNPTLATIYLFAILAYWSRLPGVGIPTPFFILYQADFVDLFTFIIAINIGSPQAAVFTVFCNFASRAAGIFPSWDGVIKDASSQAFLSFFIPLVYAWTGDLFVSMMVYTLVRRLGFIVGWFIYPQWSLGQFIIIWIGATAVSLTINGFYAQYFGPYLDSLVQAGVAFNWMLFFVVTVIVFLAGFSMFSTRKSKLWDQQTFIKWIARKITGKKKKKAVEETINVQSDEEMIMSTLKEL